MRLTNSNEILTVKLITTREALITLVFQNIFQSAFHKHPFCKCSILHRSCPFSFSFPKSSSSLSASDVSKPLLILPKLAQ